MNSDNEGSVENKQREPGAVDDTSAAAEPSPEIDDSGHIVIPAVAGEKRKADKLTVMPKQPKSSKRLASKPKASDYQYSNRVLDIFEQSVIYGIIDKV